MTNVVVHVSYAAPETVRALLETPIDPGGRGRSQTLGLLDAERAGGTKVLESDVYAAGLNYVSPYDVADWFREVPFTRADDLVLTVYSQEGDLLVVAVVGGEVTAGPGPDRESMGT